MIHWINTHVELLTIPAIILAPIVTLQIQKIIEDYKEKKNRKFFIFKKLMATRANSAEFEHVQALNMIDIEFYDNKVIRNKWDIYREHLNSNNTSNDSTVQINWENNRIDHLTNLLVEMSKFFKYDFDEKIIKTGSYYPKIFGWKNQEDAMIRKGFVELFEFGKPVRIELVSKNTTKESTAKLENV